MTDICLCFEVHQPFRLKKDFFWGQKMFKRTKRTTDLFDYYFSDKDNREIFDKIAEKCYLPTNTILLDRIDEFDGKFKVSFSLSGVFVEQCERYNPDVLESFKQLGETGCVEFLDQTYYHSLTSLYSDPTEFIEQIKMHSRMMKDVFNYRPKVFENTEFIYNNKVAGIAQELGYKGIFTEGLERVIGWRSPNYVYRPVDGEIKVMLRNYKLTDDVGFRFSSEKWEEYPLTAEKYSSWLAGTPGDCINLFADYETIGEHHWADTGIHEFLRYLPDEILKWEHLNFATPLEVIERHEPRGELDVYEIGNTISWADLERDLSCWLGNTMQWACYTYHKDMLSRVKASKNLYEIWHYLGLSDHLYYMFTMGGGPGDVHSYFSPYDTPYDAFVTMMSVLSDFDSRIHEEIDQADEPFTFSRGRGRFIKTVWGKKDFLDALDEIGSASLKFHQKRGDFERWARKSLNDDKLAARLKKIDADDKKLSKKIGDAFSRDG